VISLKRTCLVLVLVLTPLVAFGQEIDSPQLDAPTAQVDQIMMPGESVVESSTPVPINFNQKVDVEKRVVYLVKGVENARIFNGHILVDEIGGTIEYEPVGIIRIKSDAESTQVSITNSKREPVDYETWPHGLIVVRQPGKFWVEITVLDFAKQIYKNQTVVLEIGTSPDTPDQPDTPDSPDTPDTPRENFDNIASKVAKLKSKIQIDRRNQVLIVFETAADRMQSFQYRQLDQAIQYIVENRPDPSGDLGLKQLYQLVAADSRSRNLSWQETQAYYREIVKGLR